MYELVRHLFSVYMLIWLAVVVGLVLVWRRCGGGLRRWLLTAGVVLWSVMSLPLTARLAMLSLEGRQPANYDRPEGAQAIVVLSGYAYIGDSLRPRAELAEDTLVRCIHAAQLYKQGARCPVVLSGGRFDAAAPELTLAALMRDFLVQLGVDQNDILLEDRSRNTYENAKFSAEILHQRGIRQAAVVTDAIHLRRAERCFRAFDIEPLPAGCRYRAREFRLSIMDFLPDPQAALRVQRSAHEWVGIIWYKLRYGV